jgi:hypothetical protein
MHPIDKKALRAAVLIHEQLAGGKGYDPPICLPEYAWNRIQELYRLVGRARDRGWQRAARQLTLDLADALNNCRGQLEHACQTLQHFRPVRRIVPVSDLYRDILALDDEFEEVEIALSDHELTVTTDRIVLEDIVLGAFEIRLNWHRLGSSTPYRVVALDPHPAVRNSDVTHPHVQDEQLCEGEGRAAVRGALTEGRLHDFFLLVSQVLHTYGRGSAYVELDNWYGVPCDDCSESVSQDDQDYCHHCEKTLCSSCALTCQGCDETCCSGCLQQCAACSREYCSPCLRTCSACRKAFCEDCREAGLCRTCHEKQLQQTKENPHAPSPPTNSPSRPAGRPRRRRSRAAAAPA